MDVGGLSDGPGAAIWGNEGVTDAFDTFMQQHRQTGSAKADGYSWDAFVGLTAEEKDKVFTLLENELPWSAEWLFQVNAERATAVVRAMEQRLRGDPYHHVYRLQEYLVKYTGDLRYQQHAIDDYPHYVDSHKPLVVEAVWRMADTDASLAFFKTIILAETSTSAASRAARCLLSAKQMPRTTDEENARYDRLVRELRSDSMEIKLLALAQIGM